MQEARICLDCDYIYYVARWEQGKTTCPRCGSRASWPVGKWLGAVADWLERRLEDGALRSDQRAC